MNGYIKLYRKLTQWGWYQDSVVKDLFLHLLLTASFKDFEWQGKTMKAGQLITGRKKLSEDLNFTEQQIRTALKKLESTKEIICESSNKYTIITVTNWESYQICGETEQPTDFVNNLLTSIERLKFSTNNLTNTNGLKNALESAIFEIEDILLTNNITNEQPTNNQQITNNQPHIKNIRSKKGKEYSLKENVIKENRRKYGEYENILLNAEEYEKLKKEFPYDYENRIERLSEYVASTGKKYKNHLATIRAWARKENPAIEKDTISRNVL